MSQDVANVPVGSKYVRALLNRHDVASMRHATQIAEILGVAYILAYRRMNGAVAWELEEIERVAAHFGETLATVFADDQPHDVVPAVLVVDGTKVKCRLLPGDVIRNPDPGALVAVRVGAQWMVMLASRATVGPAYEVRQMVVSGDPERIRRVAILDDDMQHSASLAEHFEHRGCEAQAFDRAEALLGHMKLRPFDAFVLDWVLHEGNAAELVAMIRSEDSECPIAILTGKTMDDFRIENEVSEALSTYKLLYFQKPTPPPLILTQVLRALAAQ